jgi:hypothetical protein
MVNDSLTTGVHNHAILSWANVEDGLTRVRPDHIGDGLKILLA